MENKKLPILVEHSTIQEHPITSQIPTIGNQERLGIEFEKVLCDNLWELYEE